MKKKLKIAIAVILILIILFAILLFIVTTKENSETLKTAKSEKELLRIYNLDGTTNYYDKGLYIALFTMPGPTLFSGLTGSFTSLSGSTIGGVSPRNQVKSVETENSNSSVLSIDGTISAAQDSSVSTNSTQESNSTANSQKDYSTTNIQVENVDEADITKTDGDYIYSLSEQNVIITNVKNPQEIFIESTINSPTTEAVPVDLLIDNNKLTIISETANYQKETYVNIYDISDKANPKKLKSFEIDQNYYTSRSTNDKLYIISAGYVQTEKTDNKKIKVNRTYIEDNKQKEIPLNNYKYLKDIKTNSQTYIATVDLKNLTQDIQINAYAMDVENAYVSQNAMYLLDEYYDYGEDEKEDDPMPIQLAKKVFNPKGIFGMFNEDNNYSSRTSEYNTKIYKFDIKQDGQLEFAAKNNIEGKAIDQYSMDEKDGHLRIATYNNDGSKITILNEKLEEIGKTDEVAKGEKMYSTRFMGDKAYLVTYKNTDPLFVIDLSNEATPKILGELKIPGYSTYLHPYDENHLIGIGMETKEIIRRDFEGKPTSTSIRIVGMKMALFDVSNVENPVQISQTIIGDSRTTSAVLTNPKALLFSKEKELIAIPVNNYNEDFETSEVGDSNSENINSYISYSNQKNRVAEGYFVYKINLEEGFSLKGTILHEEPKDTENNYYSYYSASRLLRGLYIENNLYTVSETAVKVNNLDTLEPVDEMNIKEEISNGRNS